MPLTNVSSNWGLERERLGPATGGRSRLKGRTVSLAFFFFANSVRPCNTPSDGDLLERSD